MKTAENHFKNSKIILHLLSALTRGKAVALQPCCSVHGWPGEWRVHFGHPVSGGRSPVRSRQFS